MTVYVSIAGDVLDGICWRHYGREGTVETVLAANPGLEALGPVLPPGTRVTLPAIEPPTQVLDVVRLWS